MSGFKHIFSSAGERSYDAGQILLYQGEVSQSFYIINSGYVKVYDINAEKEEHVLLVLGPGDIFPIFWGFKKAKKLHYFYECLEASELQVVHRDDFLTSIQTDHQTTCSLLEYYVDQSETMLGRVEVIEASSARHKVAQVLSYLADEHGLKQANNKVMIPFTVTHQMISDMAGLARETVSLQMAKLDDNGVISNGDALYLHPKRLQKFMDSDA